MRLLWVKYGELLPPDTGGKLRSYHLLRQLAERVELTLLSYVPMATPVSYDAALREIFPRAIVVRAPGLGGLSPAAAWSSLAGGVPLTVSRFTAAAVKDAVRTAVVSGGADLLLCDFLAPTACIPEDLGIPAVLFEHNVEAALWQRRADNVTGLKRLVYQWEHNALARYERAMLRRFDLTFCVSEADNLMLQQMVPGAKIRVLETGVDLAEFARPAGVDRDPNLLIFVGSMDWQPNVDGVLWFMREIWPQVSRAVPAARFRIVGRRPPPAIAALAGGSVEVTGDVDSVVPHFHAAAATVVPLRSGGGTRLKIYEAMGAGTPIVSTTVGAEGLPVQDGKDLILADSPEAIASALIQLLQHPALGATLADHALRTVAHHDWSAVAADCETQLRALLPQ